MTAVDTAADEIDPAVRRAVVQCIADSLALSPEAIELESRLIDDLGADSLDFADIVFSLGHELSIHVRDTEFSFLTRLDFSSPEVMKDGFLTPDVVARLESWLPAMAALDNKAEISPRQLFSLITVEAICLVASRAKASAQG